MQGRGERLGVEAGVMGVVLTRMSFVPGALIVGDSRALAPITFPRRDHELCIIFHFEADRKRLSGSCELHYFT